MKGNTWSIQCVSLGRRMAKSSWFNYLEDGEALEIVYRVWVLRQGSHAVLVDTGPPLDEATRRGFDGMTSVADALREAGIHPDDIRHVILTHLHWDHASSADLFPNAMFYAQPGEIAFFTGEAWENHATARFYSHREMLTKLIEAGRFPEIAEDMQLFQGIRLLRVGGHTPGSQIVVVDTAEGCAVLTGDAIPMNRNYSDAIPTGLFVDLVEVMNARSLIRRLEPSVLYTGHDPVERLVCAPK
jgi:glyoxylase-like metal-dependent hydrolase (beta-lactamase superfamily II)